MVKLIHFSHKNFFFLKKEKQLKHLSELFQDYDENSEKTTQSSRCSSRKHITKKSSIPEIPVKLPLKQYLPRKISNNLLK